VHVLLWAQAVAGESDLRDSRIQWDRHFRQGLSNVIARATGKQRADRIARQPLSSSSACSAVSRCSNCLIPALCHYTRRSTSSRMLCEVYWLLAARPVNSDAASSGMGHKVCSRGSAGCEIPVHGGPRNTQHLRNVSGSDALIPQAACLRGIGVVDLARAAALASVGCGGSQSSAGCLKVCPKCAHKGSRPGRKYALTSSLTVELPGIETDALPGNLASNLQFRYVSLQFSTSRYLRIRFRVLTASRALHNRPAYGSKGSADSRELLKLKLKDSSSTLALLTDGAIARLAATGVRVLVSDIEVPQH
jgi:hypothetical protein